MSDIDQEPISDTYIKKFMQYLMCKIEEECLFRKCEYDRKLQIRVAEINGKHQDSSDNKIITTFKKHFLLYNMKNIRELLNSARFNSNNLYRNPYITFQYNPLNRSQPLWVCISYDEINIMIQKGLTYLHNIIEESELPKVLAEEAKKEKEEKNEARIVYLEQHLAGALDKIIVLTEMVNDLQNK